MYKIAEYIPLEARKTACEKSYPILVFSRRRSLEDKCPLGEIGTYLGINGCYAPQSVVFVRDLNNLGLVLYYQIIECEAAAGKFINDWDSGVITDLCEALGVSD